MHKVKYLETLAFGSGDQSTVKLTHRFVSLMVQIHNLWEAAQRCETYAFDIERLGQHIEIHGVPSPLSKKGAYYRLGMAGLNPADFINPTCCSFVTSPELMLKSPKFRRLLRRINDKLREYAPHRA